jgi:hypothetical protein
MVTLAAC